MNFILNRIKINSILVHLRIRIVNSKSFSLNFLFNRNITPIVTEQIGNTNYKKEQYIYLD